MADLLKDKVAVVTGASRGIGKAIALWYGREGATVVCTSRTTDESPSRLPGTNDATVREIEEAGGKGLAVRCDVRLEEDVESLKAATIDAYGRCDILVNNAGISFPGDTIELPTKRWDLVMDVNVRGPYLTFKAFAPAMAERGEGIIINVSSGAAKALGKGRLSYAVSKAALDKMTVGLAAELESSGVSVISLGLELPVLTEGFELVSPGADTTGWESPDIMGEAALWLAMRASEYSGQVVTIAGLREDYKK
ncbi:MAG TPA: SDR family NAD(P)-dependent oxidoreductase [Dehalococcoidia bacterium]|jgi:NAD(P)-dependent dehydrogenase (short-subunit alcohol dehydrogenase family)|nr:SDR family NAD(P)-dependent oxidoreductase [Dehalococcoidia bacterium]